MSHLNNEHIALINCKHDFAYKLRSRNLKFGVFNINDNSFVGIREKFGSKFLETEFHFDVIETSLVVGTASPIRELEEMPYNISVISYKKLFDYIENVSSWYK